MGKVVYILYRKTNIRDGDHEPTCRLIASSKLSNILTKKNYIELKKYEDEYDTEEQVKGLFFYFIMRIPLGTLNAPGDDDGHTFWDPENRLKLEDMVWKGDLKSIRHKYRKT